MHKIKYLRVIVTEKCNLNCFYCHREGLDRKHFPSIEQSKMIDCINILLSCGIEKVKFMGGEPTLCLGLNKIIEKIKQKYPLVDISMITNGITTLETIDTLIGAGLCRINVSLHGFDKGLFKEITKGNDTQLDTALNTILYLKQKGVLGKINYVLLKNKNESEFFKVLNFIKEYNIVLDVLNYLSDNDDDLHKHYYSFEEIKQMIASENEIIKEEEFVNKNSINSNRLYLNGGGVINLKVNQLNQFNFLKSCSKCDKIQYCKEGIAAIRLTSNGLIKPCLFREDLCFDLKEYLNNHTLKEATVAVSAYLNSL